MEFNKENVVTVIVIGKSGVGKTEYILSLIDEEYRKYIKASGKGQTTRCTIENHISFRDEKVPFNINVRFKSKTKFNDERYDALEKFLISDKKFDSIRLTNDESLFELRIKELLDKIIFDEAFFDIKEFGYAEEDIKHLEEYNKIFNINYWNSLHEMIFSNDKISNDNYNCDDEVVIKATEFRKDFYSFFNIIYDMCKSKIPIEDKNSINLNENSEIAEIEKYFKVTNNGVSYSALVEKIIVDVNGNRYYKDLFRNNKIIELVVIDTYGLDHAKGMNEVELENRYNNIFRYEYEDIKSVIYLIDASSTDSPSYLSDSIPLLFKTVPSIVPYTLFTHIDEIPNDDKYQNSKAYKEIENLENSIKVAMLDLYETNSIPIDIDYVSNIYSEILDKRLGYASKFNMYDTDLIENNKNTLRKLFYSIRFKTYLGSSIIPIDVIKNNNVFINLLDANGLIRSMKFYGYPGRTIGAIRKRIEEDSELGFESTTMKSSLWSDILQDGINERFSSLKISDEEWRLMFSNYSSLNIKEIKVTLLKIYAEFSREICNGAYHYNKVKYLNESNDVYSRRLMKYLYDSQENIIDKGSDKYERKTFYLNDVYDFDSINNETKKMIGELLLQSYNDIFILLCRQHNARKLAEKISEDTKYNEKIALIENYYEQYDKNILDDEKEQFELDLENSIY